jgi:putative Mg2+ transporter-C (MgtC) family protein
MSDAEIVLRLLVAAALGAVVGLERQLSDEAAGLRTHLMVAMGAALFALISIGLRDTRLTAQIVSGIGFLGAAAIIRSGLNVFGIATAASLWVVAAIGMATAYGRWTAALVVTAVAVVVLHAGKQLEVTLLRRWRSRRGELVLGLDAAQEVDPLVRRVAATGVLVRNVEASAHADGRTLRLELQIPARVPPDAAADAARPVAQVRSFTWST